MIALFNYNESPIQFEEINGQIMANATLMCQAFGKQPIHWLRNEQTQRYMTAISKLRNRSLDDLQIVKKGGMDSGTWIDEKLVLNLARWLDVEFEIWCDERIAELSRNGHVSLDGSLPSAELSEIKQQLAELKASHSAEMAEIKALLKPRMRQIKAMSEQKIEALAAINDFWEVLNRFPLDRDYWDTDTFACMLYVRTSKAYRHYAAHGAQCGIKLLSQQDIYRILSDGDYSPFTPSTQKGDSHTVARHGLGRSHQFRYELRDNEMFVGDKKITFARKR